MGGGYVGAGHCGGRSLVEKEGLQMRDWMLGA